MSAGKGSRRRPENSRKFREGWDRVYAKKQRATARKEARRAKMGAAPL